MLMPNHLYSMCISVVVTVHKQSNLYIKKNRLLNFNNADAILHIMGKY